MTESNEFKKLKEAAERGHKNSQYQLASYYFNGCEVEKNLEEAVKWYRRAAEQGHGSAQFHLGLAYRDGKGVKKDLGQAVNWLTGSAGKGHELAQHFLIVIFSSWRWRFFDRYF